MFKVPIVSLAQKPVKNPLFSLNEMTIGSSYLFSGGGVLQAGGGYFCETVN